MKLWETATTRPPRPIRQCGSVQGVPHLLYATRSHVPAIGGAAARRLIGCDVGCVKGWLAPGCKDAQA